MALSIDSRKPARSRLAARRDRVRGMSMFSRYSLAPVHSWLPIVMVHGMVVSSAFLRPALQLIGNHHRVFAPDLPGYGLTSKPKRTLAIEEQAEVLDEWMSTVGLDQAVLVGVSLGTQIATAAAARRPDRVRGIVLASPTMEPALRSRPQALLRWLQELPNELRMTPVTVRDYLRPGLKRANETFAIALGDRPEDRLPALTIPALVLRGEHDHLVSREWAREVADRLPRGRLVEVADAPHAMNFMTPERFSRLVVDFVTASTQPQRLSEAAA